MELGIYRHWKGSRYLALFLARDCNNNANHEDVVIYVSLDPPRAGHINARRKTEFLEDVPTPDGGIAPRFVYIGPASAKTDATLFGEIERHLDETEAPLDVEASLARLKTRLAD